MDLRAGERIAGACAEHSTPRHRRRTRQWGGSIDDAETGSGQSAERLAVGMLYEYKRLGKVREADLKYCLNRLASYSVLPGGYQVHFDRVVDLAEEIMLIVRGGRSTPGENARRMLKWSPQFSDAWRNVDCISLPQVLQIFADGTEEASFIDIDLPGGTGSQAQSLQRYSRMDQFVFFELFIRSIADIRQHLPAALQLGHSQLSDAARKRITISASKAAIHGCAVHICTACTGLMSWVKDRPTENSYADETTPVLTALLRLIDPQRRAEIKRAWQLAADTAAPIKKKGERLEEELLELLMAFDPDCNDSFRDIVARIKNLVHCYEKHRGILASADMHIFYSILTPFEFGLLSAVQLPRSSVHQVLANKLYPFPQPGKLVEMGLV